MSLDSIVQVNITLETTSPTRKGFGIPLVAGYHTKYTDRVRYYTSLLGLIADGFATSDGIYKAVKAVLSQNPRPQKVGVGRFDVASVMTVNVTPVVKNSHEYTVTLNGTPFTFTSSGGATATEIVNNLRDAINAGTVPVTASNAADVLHLVADVAGDLFSCAVDYGDGLPQNITADTSDVAAQLAAISLFDDGWYGLVLADQGKDQIINCAGYVETVKKLAIFTSGDADCLDAGSTADVAYLIKSGGYARSAVLFSRKPGEFSGGAWEGEELPNDPGSSTWKFKTLVSIDPDSFTESEQAALTAKNCNFYQVVAGIPITQEGVTGSGEYIDVTIFIDWLQARMQERIFGILTNVKKVPFTDHGIALIEGAIRAQLREGVDAGGLADNDLLQVTVPKAANVSGADKASRTLEPVSFQGELAGAIHFLVINGTVTV